MPFVTIISDWAGSDFYTGAIKGALLSKVEDLKFIEIADNINKHDITTGVFILKSCIPFYPDGTVHLFCIRTQITNNEKILIVKYKNQYIISNEYCLRSFGFENNDIEIIIPEQETYNGTFPELDIYVPLATHLLTGKSFYDAGKLYPGNIPDFASKPEIRKEKDLIIIDAHIIYIDSYGNLITDLKKEQFEELVGIKKFEITIENSREKINKISKKYDDVEKGDILALFNSLGLLEIAYNYGRAIDLVKVKLKSIIRIIV
ncbi:MAG: hypothetical protein Kow0068_07310 [Marinilabiliales bacterium]